MKFGLKSSVQIALQNEKNGTMPRNGFYDGDMPSTHKKEETDLLNFCLQTQGYSSPVVNVVNKCARKNTHKWSCGFGACEICTPCRREFRRASVFNINHWCLRLK